MRGSKALASCMASGVLALGSIVASGPVTAQSSAADEIAKYRALLAEGNPAELVELQGETLWKTARGPKNVSLEQCDLGLGPGKIKGAYVQLPRYFADTGRVMDAESRIVHCMVTLQGMAREDVVKKPFSGTNEPATDLEALTSFVVAESRGATIAIPQTHREEKAAYLRGQKIFYYRGGPYDFSCASCHGEDGKRIRLQDLPNLTQPKGAQVAFATWPAYRVSQGAVRTMQWRLHDCFRQQRFPELVYGSQASIDLISFLGVSANGGKMDAPAIKR
jgi:sulfur-oxidizing protein SoxA